MSPVYYKSKRGLNVFAEDHTAEGITIMTAEPSRFMRGTIFLVFGLLVAVLAWSFYGRVDVIVSATGGVATETPQNHVYVPVKGVLVDLYIAEGMPVRSGDVLARINSQAAIQIAGQATMAEMKVADAERKKKEFPAKLEAMRIRLEFLAVSIEDAESDLELLKADDMAKLGEEQRLKLAKVLAKVQKAQAQRDHAKQVLEQHERLFNTPSGGGISRQQVADKQKDYHEQEINFQLSETELGQFEVDLGKEYAKRLEDREKKTTNLISLRSQHETHLVTIKSAAANIEAGLKLARTQARIAARINYDDIDEDNFLRIRATQDGVITSVTQTQIGAMIEEKTPLAVIAPKGARKILEIEINERDRAFLTLGMPAKLKFNSFPYQRYGFLSGKVEFIAPVTSYNRATKTTYYKARVGLERDYFVVNDVRTPIRYGMAAKAEIVLRKRRLVDLVLDPMRSATAG